MAPPQRITQVTLDDEDPQKRNEALIIEIDVLKDKLADAEEDVYELATRVAALYGVHTIGQLTPDKVHGLYTEIEKAIEAFVGPMDRFIRDNAEHKARVDAAMQMEGSAKAFRSAIRGNPELQAAAVNPDTNVIDIWVAFIWRFLLQRVLSDDAMLDFYSDEDEMNQNPGYYIRNLNEMEYLMTQARDPIFGLYARRLWRRQALHAIFRTADFDWVTSIRTAKMEDLSQNLMRSFQVFSRPFPEGRDLELIRAIVAAAVKLGEHVMIEADDIWTIELEGVTGDEDDFYDNLDDFGLKPVGTLTELKDNAPLDSLKRRFSLDSIKERVKKLCVVRPALRYRHVQPHGEGYGDAVHKVKPQVLVALKELPWPEETIAVYTQHDELVFYNMAKSLGLIDEPLEEQ